MAAPSVLLKVWRHRLSLGVPGRRSFWGEKKKQDQPVVEPMKDVCPVIDVCPPPRSKKYLPPEYLQNHLESRVREIWGSSVLSDWQRTSLADIGLKYQLLAQMAADLDHTVPNNQLHQMKSVGDVLDFYSTPVKDISKLDELGMQELPSNLKINWE
ncbi:large ribosomal subunit protein mL50 [Pantherophis guttatus]|uniref:Large ribosomal subunit protein mL50 n=1 Tax=Pantherophis guttatus TaxID=94885 RepID=A0A6P9BDX7_PANGU|nr:large ribosomal subunit protein mL50 [Pantherophis guttatus]